MADANPRQFASLDASGLGGSLTNRPPSSTSVGDPIDFEAINRQVINDRTKPDYVYKESAVESTLRKQQDIAASLRIKQEYADQQAANALQRQGEQAQRRELANRISNSPGSPEVAQPSPESHLEAPPPSTPNRQPAPSTGRPPPTPNGTAARASPLVEPTATPGPAALAEPVRPGGGGFGALPRSLPQAAGRFAIPGVFAAADFGIRVYAGQPIGQAASGAVASTVGAFAGGIVGTAIAGPIGGVIGAMVGGYAGGLLSDAFFSQNLPTTGAPPNPEPPSQYLTYRGSQYAVVFLWWYKAFPNIKSQATTHVWGEVGGIGESGNNVTISCRGSVFGDIQEFHPVVCVAAASPVSGSLVNITLDRVVFTPTEPNYNLVAPPPDSRTPASQNHPGNRDYAAPTGMPNVAPKPNNYGTGGTVDGNTPNGNGYFPGHGGLASRGRVWGIGCRV